MRSVKFFLNLLKPRDDAFSLGITAYLDDPLRHPDIARMDARALADLPMPVLPARDRLSTVHSTSAKQERPHCGVQVQARPCDQA